MQCVFIISLRQGLHGFLEKGEEWSSNVLKFAFERDEMVEDHNGGRLDSFGVRRGQRMGAEV